MRRDVDCNFVMVRIPKDKIDKLLEDIEGFLSNKVIGKRQLRSFAGSMAFVAGLVPILRPFLAPLWASLAGGSTDDRTAGRVGKLIRAQRVAPCLLLNEQGDLVRRFDAGVIDEGYELVTDACPWGVGGILYKRGIPLRWFASHLTAEVLYKFGATTGDPGFNTAWEALLLLIALRLWLPRCPRSIALRVKSDNVGALRMLLKLTSQSGALATIAREVALEAAQNRQLNELVHVPGLANVDALSRQWAPQKPNLPNLGRSSARPRPQLLESGLRKKSEAVGRWQVSQNQEPGSTANTF